MPEGVARTAERAPFVLLLHGYGGSGARIARHFSFARLAEERGFMFVAPDGAEDKNRARFWNAGEACCDFDRIGTPHVVILGDIIAAARSNPRVDPDRVYVVGYSNGGFMAHRLACDLPGIAGIASVAGTVAFDPAKCKHGPRTVVQVHGDADDVVPFAGGQVLRRRAMKPHAGAEETVSGWATWSGCTESFVAGPPLDLDARVSGAETRRYSPPCAPSFALYRVAGGGHDAASDVRAMGLVLDELMREEAGP